MKLTGKEEEVVGMLRELDVQQRDKLLAEIRRTVMASRITAQVARVSKVRTVADHRIIRAFGTPPWRQRKDRLRDDESP